MRYNDYVENGVVSKMIVAGVFLVGVVGCGSSKDSPKEGAKDPPKATATASAKPAATASAAPLKPEVRFEISNLKDAKPNTAASFQSNNTTARWAPGAGATEIQTELNFEKGTGCTSVQIIVNGKPKAGESYTVTDAPMPGAGQAIVSFGEYSGTSKAPGTCGDSPVVQGWSSVSGTLKIETLSGTGFKGSFSNVSMKAVSTTSPKGTFTIQGSFQVDATKNLLRVPCEVRRGRILETELRPVLRPAQRNPCERASRGSSDL